MSPRPEDSGVPRGDRPTAPDARVKSRASEARSPAGGVPLPSRVYLVGYRATGKTSLGRSLARHLCYDFLDTDALLEPRLGMSFADYFEQRGQAAFRDEEHEVLASIARSPPVASGGGLVISTGGGMVLRPANVDLMRETGCVVWLTASADTIRRRLGEDALTASRRPALEGESAVDEVERVLAERVPLYRAASHLVIDTESAGPDDLAVELTRQLVSFSRTDSS